MSKQQLSRRKVLAGLATAGGGSAFVGSGASALFTDRETFSNNSIQASTSTSGELRLDVQPDPRTTPLPVGNTGEVAIPAWEVTLPNSTNNNPGYVWMRLVSCPEPLECAEQIWVELALECSMDPLVEGYLDEVADELRQGIPIDPDCIASEPGEQTCFEPAESVTVIFDWSVDWTFTGCQDDIDLEFEFHASQCRYSDGSQNPFEAVDPCYNEDDPSSHGISWIAFCSDSTQPINPVQPRVIEGTVDDPIKVEWSTDTPVTHVVLKAATDCKMYSYPDGADEGIIDSDTSDPEQLVSCGDVLGPTPCATAGTTGSSVKMEHVGDEFLIETEDGYEPPEPFGNNGGGS